MDLYIKELKKEINDLKERVSKLEEHIRCSSNKNNKSELNNKRHIDYYKETPGSDIYVKNLKEPKLDRFGKVCSVNEEIKEALENEIIDNYEHMTMLRLAIADEGVLSVAYLMDVQRLTLEQVIKIIGKLENLKYVEIIKF